MQRFVNCMKITNVREPARVLMPSQPHLLLVSGQNTVFAEEGMLRWQPGRTIFEDDGGCNR
jgi:hypothetical protein